MSKKNNTKKTARIPFWAGWDAYFASDAGAANIAEVINGLAAHIHGRYSWNRRHQGLPEPVLPITVSEISPDQLAVEMIVLDRRLAQFVPASVAAQVGDMDAAVALVSLGDQDGMPDVTKELTDSVFGAIALMAHGITQSRNSYTGGSDECDLNDTTMYGITDDSNPLPPEDIEGAESCLDEDEVEDLCDQYNIKSDFFFNFCTDSGAGDGTGSWTNEYVVRLMPNFSAGIEEGEFTEYDCHLCDNPQSSCTCVYDEETGDYITAEEAEEKKQLKEQAEADGDAEAPARSDGEAQA
jgi:hypothetical protein